MLLNEKPLLRDPEPGREHDVLGIGFGPSNLALAVALEELARNASRPVSARFFEARPSWTWHPGMLIDGTRMQVSFLKDLVTMRDPTSRFTFLSYLQAVERLHDFINLREFFPSRAEFDGYFRWAADQFAQVVSYGHRVEQLEPARSESSGPFDLLRVRAVDRSGARHCWLTRNVVVAVGGKPSIPEPAVNALGDRVFHSSEYLYKLGAAFANQRGAYHFVVVGSGQSAAEIWHHLATTYPNAQVTAALRTFAFRPADDSHFVNEIFRPDLVDTIYGMEGEERLALLQSHRNTNYSVVDLGLIRSLYDLMYQQRVTGRTRLAVLPLVEVRKVTDHGTAVQIEFERLLEGGFVNLEVDAVILGTGYSRAWNEELFSGFDGLLARSSEAAPPSVERDYSIRSDERLTARIFVQGIAEDTHGIGDSLLSNLAQRSAEIARSCLDTLRA